jgi:glycosyltransferase involved in cell wall biosynthesis
VAFLDDDDTIDPDHLETLAAAPDADVLAPFCRFDGPAIPAKYVNRRYERSALRAHGIFPITVLARRQAIIDAGSFDPSDRYEDWSLWNRMADNGCRFEILPVVTWTYRTAHRDRRTNAA